LLQLNRLALHLPCRHTLKRRCGQKTIMVMIFFEEALEECHGPLFAMFFDRVAFSNWKRDSRSEAKRGICLRNSARQIDGFLPGKSAISNGRSKELKKNVN
jgi:hypothetical protein